MTLRRWLSDVLTASRYCACLEQRILEQRQDFTERLAEKDARIKELRTEVAALKLESDRMRSAITGVPMVERPAKPPVVPEFDGPLDWDAELQRMLEKEMRDGVPVERRQIIQQPATDEAAREVDDGKEV